MPPPKKAAKKAAKKAVKKAAKKAAKKSAPHHHEKHRDAKDLRRAYEHMGRLQVLRNTLKPSAADTISVLTKLAQKEVAGGHNKDAADLVRASEHLGFAFLADDSPAAGRISAELEQSITEHFDELTRRAEEHWNDHEPHSSALSAIYESSRKSAAKAFKAGAYHQALEFVRAAEALAHVKQSGPPALETGTKSLKAKGDWLLE